MKSAGEEWPAFEYSRPTTWDSSVTTAARGELVKTVMADNPPWLFRTFVFLEVKLCLEYQELPQATKTPDKDPRIERDHTSKVSEFGLILGIMNSIDSLFDPV